MAFIRFFDYLGEHVPALGAFVVCLIFVSVLCLIFYKLGSHAENQRWRWDVQHMPAVIGQDIRERLERKLELAEAHAQWLQARLNTVLPLTSGIVDLVHKATGQKP